MTPELRDRLEGGHSPFDGWSIQSEPTGLESMRRHVHAVSQILRVPSSALFWFKDWTFHDGCPSPPRPFSWSEFDARMAAGVESFEVGDDRCAFAIVPRDLRWVFRIEVPEAFEDPRRETVRFDLTGPLPLVRALVEELAPLPLAFGPASAFFVPNG